MWRKRRLPPRLTDSVIEYDPPREPRRHWADVAESGIKRAGRELLDGYEWLAVWAPPVWVFWRYPPPNQPTWAVMLYGVLAVLAFAAMMRRLRRG